MNINSSRKDFIRNVSVSCGILMASRGLADHNNANQEDFLDVGQRDTDLVLPETYLNYLKDGNSRGFAALEKLEHGFQKIIAEINTTSVTDTPAVWLVYNMGVIVKTRKSLFSIDLVHRRSLELVPMLDFALITHNHTDHYLPEFYRNMNNSGKTVINNFIDNYGAADWRKGGSDWYAAGGYTRAVKVFHLRDVEIRTTLSDHNRYLIDYTTAFEIKVGNWRMYHSGDSFNVDKLNPIWGRPDLWVAFPGCGIDIAAGARKLQPQHLAFGHLWELSHSTGRLTTPMVRTALDRVRREGINVSVPMWGERIV